MSTLVPSYRLLGVGVSAVQIPDVVSRLEDWIRLREGCRYVAVTGMHGITEAQHDPQFRHVLNSAALVVPDGMPLIWLGRLRGRALRRRVYGPELMATFCADTASTGYRHFLYGGEPGLAERLAAIFAERFPGLAIAGTYSPPFRALSAAEDERITAQINDSRADIIWVGLSTPKQEKWMYEHARRLNAPVLVGVGAAFDFHAGAKRQAPRWMQEHGFEWLFRLLQEPRRLWRRYLVYGSEFALKVFLEQLHLRKFD